MAHPVEALLRPPVEYVSAVTCVILAITAWVLQDYMLFTPVIGMALSGVFVATAIWRAHDGWRLQRYQRGLGVITPFSVDEVPKDRKRLYLGRGFRWTGHHTQRLRDTRTRDGMQLIERVSRTHTHEHVGGAPELHAVGLWEGERDVWLPMSQRKGHMLVLGATGAGKTRLAETLIDQDIARGNTVIVFDPKGDADLLLRVYAATERAGRLDNFYVMHLAHPEQSARYNPIGSYTRVTQVAQRLSEPLPDQGNSAAFKEFAWRFSNIIARALNELGERPDLVHMRQYVMNIEPLVLRYLKHWFEKIGQGAVWGDVESKDDDKQKGGYSNRAKTACIHARLFLAKPGFYDAVADGLVSVVDYERNYYDKIVSSLLPLLEKLTTGPVGELLSPEYLDVDDERPILDWRKAIHEQAVVYVGLDALTDATVASAVGQAMFEDLTAVAGALYAYGDVDESDRRGALPPKMPAQQVCIHADELSAITSGSVLNLLSRGRGAGIELTCYTQTLHDLVTGFGDRDMARVAIGNLNTLVMMRVRDEETARLLTDQLPRVEVQKLMAVSGTHDSATPSSDVEFTSNTQQRITTQEVSMLESGDVTRLPIGSAFVLAEGGHLYKTRIPLAKQSDDELPKSVAQMVESMRSKGQAPEKWWLTAESSLLDGIAGADVSDDDESEQ